MTRARLLWILALLPTTNAFAAAQSAREREVEALVAKQAAADDDWDTEVLSDKAKKRLHDLFEDLLEDPRSLEAGETPFLTPRSRIDELRPTGGDAREVGGTRVRRPPITSGTANEADKSTSPAEAFVRLVAPFRSGTVEIHTKIIAVSGVSEAGFETVALYSAAGATEGGRLQQNARWRIGWSLGESDVPRIESVETLAFEEIEAPRPQFVESTAAVLPLEGALAEQLQRGGDSWFGRIDDLGESSFFGHNGLAIGDVNGDGRDDLYVAMGNGLPNKLFVQAEDGTVTDMAHAAGVAWLDDTKGVLLIDYDNDGDQDLFCTFGPTIVLSTNDGEGNFTPARSMRGATDAAFYSLSAADYDLDGDLDLYACRYVKSRYGESLPVPFHDATNGPPNHLMRNDVPDGFTDVTGDVGLDDGNDRFSLSSSWSDYDGDGDPDLYVANDFGRNNLYRNDDGKFVDVAAELGVEDMSAGMGVSWGDFDCDGDPDILVSNMFSSAGRRIAYQPRFKEGDDELRGDIQRHSLGNSLLVNDGDGGFVDASDSAGIRMGRWAWGAEFVDFNNDGYADMLVPNGFLTNELDDDL